MTYSSEIGATVNEIAPKLTFALWIPSFMYLGADIYDKYKNDKNEYSPSSKRGVKEAIRQAMLFFILPTTATILGQKLTSPIGKLISDNLSINSKDAIYRHSKEVLNECIGDNFHNKEHFKDLMKNSLKNKIASLQVERNSNNPIKRFYRYLKGYYSLPDSDINKLLNFANKNADLIFEVKDALVNNKDSKLVSKKLRNKYTRRLNQTKNLYGKDYSEQVLRSILKEFQNKLIVKNKVLKTVGGVISCVILMHPFSYLVNKILMPKYITPGMDIISTKFKSSNLIRQHLELIEIKKKKDAETTSILTLHEKTLPQEQKALSE